MSDNANSNVGLVYNLTLGGKEIPSTAQQSGKYLTNNGSAVSWANLPSYGNIQNNGTLQTTDISIDNGDKLIVTDSSNSNKVARTSLSFDGSTTSQYLSKKGTWVNTPTKVSDLTNDSGFLTSVPSHASSGTTYGTGTGSNYGHLKLSDSTSLVSGTSGGIAATPSAVKSAYDLASGKQANITATGLLVGDGSGGVTAATMGTNMTLSSGTLSSKGLKKYTATLTTTWDSSNSYYTQTVSGGTCTGLKASYDVPPIVDVSLSGEDAQADAALLEAWALVGLVETGTNSITAKCTGDAPSVYIPLTIMVWE